MISQEWNVYLTGQEYVVITTKAGSADEALDNSSFLRIFFLTSLFISFTCSCVKHWKVTAPSVFILSLYHA